MPVTQLVPVAEEALAKRSIFVNVINNYHSLRSFFMSKITTSDSSCRFTDRTHYTLENETPAPATAAPTAAVVTPTTPENKAPIVKDVYTPPLVTTPAKNKNCLGIPY